MRTRQVRSPMASMDSARPPECICGNRSAISASRRSMLGRSPEQLCVGIPEVSNFCHLAALAKVPMFVASLAKTATRGPAPMQLMIRLTIAALVAVAFTHYSGVAAAQGAVKQIPLTEKHVEGFISAQKDMATVAEKMQGNSDKPDPKVQAELETIAKKHGFTSFQEYDDVAANISMVMAGIDPQSKAFTEPKVAIQKEIDEVKADNSIPEKEKKQMLDELGEALKSAQPVANPENIELVKKYYEKIDAVLQ